MAVSYKTPGVYIEEKNAFPNSVVAVATAVPVFIGYTKRAENLGKKVFNKPTRVTSLVEFEQIFGAAPEFKFAITKLDDEAAEQEREKFPLNTADGRADHKIAWPEGTSVYRLYSSVKLFYQNGGGACYILSVGDYSSPIDADQLVSVIPLLKDEPEPTMVLVPDALSLETPDKYFKVYTTCLDHCQSVQNRVTMMDVFGGNSDTKYDSRELIKGFRGGVGANYLQWGAAYFPWLDTNVISDREITFLNFDKDELAALLKVGDEEYDETIDRILKSEKVEGKPGFYKVTVEEAAEDGSISEVEKEVEESIFLALEANLRGMSSVYKGLIVKEAVKKMNLLPASAAMAGVYTAVDNSRGVWKAPANVSLNSVIAPNVNIGNDLNDDLNMPLNGKAVNAIRSFPGQGVIVWGARTMDGNSQDWRYINVRRTMIFIEQSIKAAAQAYVFEPNDASTWVLVQGMISNFLNNIWKAGGLFGSTPGDAYDVQIGLGTTMTATDILDGYMRITVRVAVVRPAEFIVITFQQKMAEA